MTDRPDPPVFADATDTLHRSVTTKGGLLRFDALKQSGGGAWVAIPFECTLEELEHIVQAARSAPMA